MKSNKGITLISLMIYIVVLAIVIGMVSLFTKYFYKNTEETVVSNNASIQYMNFLAYLVDDINSGNIDIIEVTDTNDSINIFLDDNSTHQYAFSNNKIYYVFYDSSNTKKKQISLCGNVTSCTFSYEDNKLSVSVVIDSVTYGNTFSI